MEDTTNNTSSTTKEETESRSTTPFYYSSAWSFNEVIRAILRCLGLEKTDFQQDPSTPKKEDDGKAINENGKESSAADSTEEDDAADPPSTTADPSYTGTGLQVSFSTPSRPDTGTGSGGQIN